MKQIKEILKRQAERATGARGAVVTVVGGYFIYMGFRMLANTKAGLSSMSMPLTIVLMILMILVGAVVIAYGIFLFIEGWKRQKDSFSDMEDNENNTDEEGDNEL